MSRTATPNVAALHAALGIPPGYAATRRLAVQLPPPFWVETGLDRGGRPIWLDAAASRAFRQLSEAAQQDGIPILVISAYRSIHHQARLIRRQLERGVALDTVLGRIAPPGYSEHHTGRALDLSTTDEVEPLTESFEETVLFDWLTRCADRFGFRLSYPRNNPLGFIYEPWHWAYACNS
ncbi:D-alanyl-D-alanine carboxypeptidase [mine drainage metagenome]|uniref:D-alanyl-D-alanine carboxypeptidase n=1 Tax=mine drainage metagenome TaxID=410659 RepID=T1ASH7_9ZZZZ